MPRGQGRGGSRQGTPGRGYANRTDLATRPDMSKNTASTGGQAPPSPTPPGGPTPGGAPPTQSPPTPSRSPEDSPMLTEPSQRPGEGLTHGLPSGPGPGPEALGTRTYSQQRAEDIGLIKSMLPELQAATTFDGAPETFKALVTYLKRL